MIVFFQYFFSVMDVELIVIYGYEFQYMVEGNLRKIDIFIGNVLQSRGWLLNLGFWKYWERVNFWIISVVYLIEYLDEVVDSQVIFSIFFGVVV